MTLYASHLINLLSEGHQVSIKKEILNKIFHLSKSFPLDNKSSSKEQQISVNDSCGNIIGAIDVFEEGYIEENVSGKENLSPDGKSSYKENHLCVNDSSSNIIGANATEESRCSKKLHVPRFWYRTVMHLVFGCS